MRPKPLRSFAIATRIKAAPTGVDLMLKIGTALLMTFAATLVLVHAEAYFAPSLTVFWSARLCKSTLEQLVPLLRQAASLLDTEAVRVPRTAE